MNDEANSIPFPALTQAQRLHIEIYGYVIIENVLNQSEVKAIVDTLYGIEDDFRRTGELPGPSILHGQPGLGGFQRVAFLQELDRDIFRRADEGHLALARRPGSGARFSTP